MHRVELKGILRLKAFATYVAVPNAPCGVERFYRANDSDKPVLFLMYRVELKERRSDAMDIEELSS